MNVRNFLVIFRSVEDLIDENGLLKQLCSEEGGRNAVANVSPGFAAPDEVLCLGFHEVAPVCLCIRLPAVQQLRLFSLFAT